MDGILHVTAEETLSKNRKEIEITWTGGDSDEIERMIKEAEEAAEEDAKIGSGITGGVVGIGENKNKTLGLILVGIAVIVGVLVYSRRKER